MNAPQRLVSPGRRVVATAVLGYALDQEREKKDGLEISIGQRGISVEKK
jgi:hypothetical protein